MSNIKNIIFDLGGVLVNLDLPRCRAAFHSLGMPEVAELISPYYPAEMIGQLERGDITVHEMCDRMRELSHAPQVTDDQIKWAYGEFLVDIPVRNLRAIEALRAKGIRTYVLSNNNPASMEHIRQGFLAHGKPMEEYFDKMYLSYRLRELKPSEEIFLKVMADSGMRPEETLFIDDGQKNIDTARRLGFRVYMPAPGENFTHIFEDILQ